MQINKIQSDNTNFTSIRFSKSARKHISKTFSTEEVKELGRVIQNHKQISPDIIVGTTRNSFGSTRLRARINGEELFDSLFFENGFEFLEKTALYAKAIYKQLGSSYIFIKKYL